jgi:hypothetical protein
MEKMMSGHPGIFPVDELVAAHFMREDRHILGDRELAAITGGAPSTMVGAFGYMVHIPMGIPCPPSTKPAK